MSLALLVVGVIDHGCMNIDCSGAAPNSFWLVRLGRDLMRKLGGENTAAPASGLTASRRLRARVLAG